MPVGAIEDERNLPPEEEDGAKEEEVKGVDVVEEYDVEDHVDGDPELRFD